LLKQLFVNTDCIIIGGSVRAAAASAIRAGLRPWCADKFADADLCAMAPTRFIVGDDYPDSLPSLIRDAPRGPVIYTGGLENYPAIIGAISHERTIWGNSSETLIGVRDPFRVASLLRRHGLPSLPVSEEPFRDRSCVRKLRASAGGGGIRMAAADDAPLDGWYFQQFQPGEAYAAIFCAHRSLELLGVTRQLTGCEWLNAQPFAYAGSIGPVELMATPQAALERIARVLVDEFQLRGLFGIDFVLDDDQVWLIEINPRYTASVEVLERAFDFTAITHHRAAFTGEPLPPRGLPLRYAGKAIYYAPFSLKIPDELFTHREWLADLPRPGDRIEERWPVVTIFAEGEAPEIVELRLRERVRIIADCLAASL